MWFCVGVSGLLGQFVAVVKVSLHSDGLTEH